MGRIEGNSMLNSNDFSYRIRRYCDGDILWHLDFWEACFNYGKVYHLVKFRIYAQDKKYLKVENHHIQMDLDSNLHQFLIVEFNSDSVIDILEEYLEDDYQLTADDIEGIKAGLDNSYCDMYYSFIMYDYYDEDGENNYYHEEAIICCEDFYTGYDDKEYIIFDDMQEAINYIHYYLEDDWVIDENTY